MADENSADFYEEKCTEDGRVIVHEEMKGDGEDLSTHDIQVEKRALVDSQLPWVFIGEYQRYKCSEDEEEGNPEEDAASCIRAFRSVEDANEAAREYMNKRLDEVGVVEWEEDIKSLGCIGIDVGDAMGPHHFCLVDRYTVR